MQPKIDLITLFSENVGEMFRFYRDVLGFEPQGEVDESAIGYVEFRHEGVRFAVCAAKVMRDITQNHPAYTAAVSGQRLEFAFREESAAAVDATYATLIEKGATPIHPPQRMPWNQYTGLFADPDGNVHEVFADVS